MRVATLAAAIVPEDIFDAFREVKEAPDPLKPVAVSNPDEELNDKLVPVLGGKVPVASVVNKGKQVLSDDSSVTTRLVAVDTVPNESTPAPFVTRACPLLP